MMNNPLKQLLLWISNHQKRKIQRIAYKLWEEDGKPSFWFGAKSNYYQLKASQQLNSAKLKFLNPLHLAYITEKRLESLLSFLKTLAILEILSILSNITIVIALIIFIFTEEQRRNAEIYQAWQVITTAYEQPGSGGRKEALEFLNSSPRRFPLFWLKWTPQSLAGLAAPNAHLVEVQLPEADLRSANLQEARLDKANLQEANLFRANLQKADLFRANLQKADLFRANLQKADLFGANLQKNRLDNANLQKSYLWNANLQEARLNSANLQEAIYTNQNTPQAVCQKLRLKHPCPTIFPDNFHPESHHMILITNLNQLEEILEKYRH